MSAEAEPAPLDLGTWVRRLRGPAIFVVIGLALAAVLAVVGRAPNSTPLDPRNPAPDGTRALAALLADRGDTLTVADRVSDLRTTAGTTIVISNPQAVTEASLHDLAASQATIVVVQPDDRVLNALGVGASFADVAAEGDVVSPECPLPAAVVAGDVRISGYLYRTDATVGAATTCYPDNGSASLVVATRPSGGRTAVIGSAGTLTNQYLASQGDAALALGLLDSSSVQWAPQSLQAMSAPKSQQGLLNLLPPRLLWAVLQLFIAVVLLALWRARRLGPLVTEPLPVVVRAAETVEGSGRLLHASRARAGAAASLRTATIERLVRLLRLPTDAAPDVIIPTVATQAGRPTATVNTVLYGDPPNDDSALVQLASQLSSLEADARRTSRLGGPR